MKFKTALIRLMAMEKRFDKLTDTQGYHSLYTSFSMNAGHAVEGVRLNGYAKRSTIVSAFRHLDGEIKEEYEEIAELMKTQKKALLELETLRDIINAFPACNSCKGDQGAGGENRASEWEDCEECNGYGMVIPNEDHDQEEKWFELVEEGLRQRK